MRADLQKHGATLASAGRLALDHREAAAALGVAQNTLRDYVQRHGLPVVRVGRRTLYPVHELRRWLSEQAHRGSEDADAGTEVSR
jgi:excisionase family DNA binding protein